MYSRPQRLLGEALEFSCTKDPLKTAAIFNEKVYSYAELKECAQNLAFHLANAGIEKGDRVGNIHE